MKSITGLLLLANLLVAGWFVGQTYWPRTVSAQMVPIHVDRLSLRSQSALPGWVSAQASGETSAALCMEWRGLKPDELVAAREQLKKLVGERVMSFSEVPLETRYWVIFPPLPSAESATAKLSELTAAGLQDTFLIKEGVWRNAISLGLFTDAASAARRVREVEDRGVLGTRVETQAQPGSGYYFLVRSEDPDALKNLGDIRQTYPNSRQSRVACPT